MKKKKMMALMVATITSTLLSNTANAKPYFGLDYNKSKVDYNKNDVIVSDGTLLTDVNKDEYNNKSLKGYTVYVGYQVNKEFALELSYTDSLKASQNSSTPLIWGDNLNPVSVTTDVNIDMIGIDGLYTYQVKKFSLYGGTGLSLIRYEESVDFKDEGITRLTASENELGLGVNCKIGAEYQLSDHFGLRAGVKYTKAFMYNVDDVITYHIGIKLQ